MAIDETSTAKRLESMRGHGTLRAMNPGTAGLFRPGKVVEMGPMGDYRHWLCLLEASGLILRSTIMVTENEAMSGGHLPSFWTKKWRDAFADLHEQALRVEASEEPQAPDYIVEPPRNGPVKSE